MLPEQAQFRTSDPLLRTDLEREHRAVREEFRLAGQFFAPGPVMVYPQSPTYQANPWECVVVNNHCAVTLPSLGPESAGVEVSFLRRSGTITFASDTAAKVQNAASFSHAVDRRGVYQFDGLDWWA